MNSQVLHKLLYSHSYLHLAFYKIQKSNFSTGSFPLDDYLKQVDIFKVKNIRYLGKKQKLGTKGILGIVQSILRIKCQEEITTILFSPVKQLPRNYL